MQFCEDLTTTKAAVRTIEKWRPSESKEGRQSPNLSATSKFARTTVDAIAQWWRQEGCKRYPEAREIFILTDGGGSNGSRCRAWKKAIQDAICIPMGLTVSVSHYPPGASKWNPIEHRLFSQISRNWAGEPLTDIDKALNFIRTTKTRSGLVVNAQLLADNYDKGIRISDKQMKLLNLARHVTLGRWNYTLHPEQIVN